jgi:spore coat polysaccharide biosynthesis protein SpsF (cytidylyltransferase family)
MKVRNNIDNVFILECEWCHSTIRVTLHEHANIELYKHTVRYLCCEVCNMTTDDFERNKSTI